MSMDPTKQDVTQMVVDYHIGKGIHELWRPQLQRTILKIRSISRDIQDLERSLKKGTILSSSVRVASGVMTFVGILGAPFTFGGSLSLTAVGTVIGLGSEAGNMLQRWINSSEIKSKCYTVVTLLEVNKNLTTELTNQTKKLHRIQTRIPLDALAAVACKEGDVLVTVMARNIPNIKLVSVKLGLMLEPTGSPVFLSATFRSTGETVSPMVANVVSGIAKKSLHLMGAAAVGIDILKTIVKMVENVKALDQRELSDLVIALEGTANKMENEMKIFDEMYATPSSVQNSLIKKT